MWLVSGAAIVLAAVAVVLTALREASLEAPVPVRTGQVDLDELRRPDLPSAWRGYDRGHVEALLARAAATIDELRHYGTTADTTVRARPSFLTLPESSGEELEDAGGDGPGSLDR